MKFDYYIFLDYSENLIGYNIIEKDKVKELLEKTSRFKHYKGSKNRKVYLKHIHNTIKKKKITSYFLRFKICEMRNNLEIYADILGFIKKHENCMIFISVDDKQYIKFKKLVNIVDGETAKVVKEGNLEKNTDEYRMSLIIDNLLNIKRRQQR